MWILKSWWTLKIKEKYSIPLGMANGQKILKMYQCKKRAENEKKEKRMLMKKLM